MILSVREIPVQIGTELRHVRIPADPDSTMQSNWELYGEDEAFFPFWLEAWPSSYGLYDYFLKANISLDNALEVGCGCGVLAQLLEGNGGQIIHTDIVPSACAFAYSQLRETRGRSVLAMDMLRPCLAEIPPVVFGADLFYEYRLVEMICEFVRKYLPMSGVAYFADPERPSRPQVPSLLWNSGLQVEKIDWQYALNGKPHKIAIWKLSPARASGL